MASIKFARTVAYRANPDLDEEEKEEVGGGAEDEEQRGTPSREEAARRVAEREERRRAEAQDRQEREKDRQEVDGLRKFREDAEPKLKLVERLGEVFGGGRDGQEKRPARPDPYDPDYQAKMDTYEEHLIQRAEERAAKRAHENLTAEQQQRQEEDRAKARTRANDELVGSFFDDDIDGHPNPRKDWPQEKRNQLLSFAASRLRPSGPHGNFTEEDLEITEERLFREEVLARAEAKGADKIMGHLGAPRKTIRKPAGAKRTETEVDEAAVEFLNRIERMSHGRQVAALEKLEVEDPEIYAYYVHTLQEAEKDEE